MTTYTKNQIESGELNAQELLLSFSTGNNAATKTPSLCKGVHNGAIQGKPVSIAVLTAYAEFMAAKSAELAEALQSGYIAPRHKMQYAVAQVEKPLEGHVMTAAEWRESCIDKLPPLPEPDYISHAALIDTITESMTKAQIWTIVCEAKALVDVKRYSISDLTTEQIDKYHDLLNKERAIEDATIALSVYLDDVKPVKESDCMIQGKFNPPSGTGELFDRLLTEEKYTIIRQTSVNAVVDSKYNVVEPGYILFSIKVI
jgi:hypothetical protein